MVAVPGVRPVTTPVEEPTGATALLLLLHTPPVVVSEKVVVEPSQTVAAPDIGAGVWLTNISTTCKQPVGSV